MDLCKEVQDKEAYLVDNMGLHKEVQAMEVELEGIVDQNKEDLVKRDQTGEDIVDLCMGFGEEKVHIEDIMGLHKDI